MNLSAQPRVLLVDDEPFIMRAVTKLLEGAGFSVDSCNQWTEVPGKIRDMQPDVILLDYHMPTLKGTDVCVALKNNDATDAKIILFSSEEEDFLRKAVQECYADGFIRKGTPPMELVTRVRTVAGAA